MEAQSQELADLIRGAIEYKKAREKLHQLTFEDMREELGFSVARLSSYHTGKRIPPSEFAEQLAKYFFKTDKERKKHFVEAINSIRTAARQNKGRTNRGSLLERLAAGEKLRVATFKSELFTGTPGDFFDLLFERFFKLSGLTPSRLKFPESEILNALWKGDLDLCQACLASADRSVWSHFWTTPIRFSLGAVIHRKREADKKRVRDILILDNFDIKCIRPIVVKGEAGAIYCKEKLGIEEMDVLPEDDAEQLAERLRQTSTGDQFPVVVVDEYTTFRVLEALGKDGIPVIHLSTRKNIREDRARGELPQYFLSFACSRRQQELRQMIDQSFWLFLSTELHTTATALAMLYENLMAIKLAPPGAVTAIVDRYFSHPSDPRPGELASLRFQHARDWTFYTLALDRKSIETYPSSGLPWKPILERAREIVQATVTEEEINNQINFCTDYDSEPPLSHDQFHRLCEIFDLPDPPLTDAQRQYVFEDRKMVSKTIQSVLRGGPVPPLEPRIERFSPLTEEASAIVSGFIGEISRMYIRELGELNDASKQIREFLDPAIEDPIERHKRLAKEFSAGVILASHGKHGEHYIGSACLRPYKGTEPKKGELEVCYLFVLERFRNLKIAQRLLAAAHQAAREGRCSALIFEALPQYFEGILYLEKCGFTVMAKRKGKFGRVVLEYPTSKEFALR